MDDEISNEFFEWIRHGNTGCLFAQRFSIDPLRSQYWASSVVPGRDDYARIASIVNTFFEGSVGAGEAAQVILPDIRTAEHIVSLANALCATQQWFCVAYENPEQTDTLLIGLRWFLPDDRHLNWALGFANLDSMPITRRSPYTALIVRPDGPGKAPEIALPKPNEARERPLDRGRIPVHLADMETKMTDDQIKKHWGGTQKRKAAVLKDDQHARAAKAKITFSLPLESLNQLNCISDTIAMK